MIRVLLVDDEAPARSRLRRLLAGIAGVEVAGEAANGVEALDLASSLKPDALFLDIDMPELDGLAAAAELGPEGPRIVFVTAYDEHALKAFELCAIDYLVKPVSEERLRAAVSKLARDQEPSPLRLAVRTGQKYVVVDPSRVSAILARDHYAAILIDGRELLADAPLEDVARKLDPDRFFRIHRSAVINLDHLKQLERQGDRKYDAILADAASTRIPVSRDRLEGLRSKLGL